MYDLINYTHIFFLPIDFVVLAQLTSEVFQDKILINLISIHWVKFTENNLKFSTHFHSLKCASEVWYTKCRRIVA